MNLTRMAGLFGLLPSFVSCEAPRQTSFEDYKMIDLSYTFDAWSLYISQAPAGAAMLFLSARPHEVIETKEVAG